MSNTRKLSEIEKDTYEVVKTIFDPEIPVNIFALGLIYRVEAKEGGLLEIDMTLTAPNCPMAEDLVREVETKTGEIEGVDQVDLNLTFDPPWDKSMMSDEAKLDLGFM